MDSNVFNSKELKKFLIKITLKMEFYINILIVPIAIFFSFVASEMSREKMKDAFVFDVIAATIAMLIGMFLRYRKLVGIYKHFIATKNFKYMKKALLTYPMFEVKVIIFRWFFGVPLAYIQLYFAYGYNPMELMAYAIGMIMSAIVNSSVVYFTAENLLAPYLSDERVKREFISEEEIQKFPLFQRALARMFPVFLVPFVVFGYFLLLISLGELKVEILLKDILFVLFFSILTIIVLIIESTKGTREELKEIITKLSSIEKGEDTEYIATLTNTEIGFVVQYVNRLISALREYEKRTEELHKEIMDFTDRLNKNSDELSESVKNEANLINQIYSEMEGVKISTDELANNSKTQEDILFQVINNTHNLSNTIEMVSEKINTLNLKANSIIISAQYGENLLNQMLANINRITELSDKMTDIIEIINEISDRINLLSLNASIEAARAGELGKGFAVVATEISKLADQTAKSIEDISSLIETSYDETQKSIQNVENTAKKIQEIIQLVHQITGMIEEIHSKTITEVDINNYLTKSIRELKELTLYIGDSVSHNKSMMDRVAEATLKINDIVKENAKNTEKLSNNISKAYSMIIKLLEK